MRLERFRMFIMFVFVMILKNEFWGSVCFVFSLRMWILSVLLVSFFVDFVG